MTKACEIVEGQCILDQIDAPTLPDDTLHQLKRRIGRSFFGLLFLFLSSLVVTANEVPWETPEEPPPVDPPHEETHTPAPSPLSLRDTLPGDLKTIFGDPSGSFAIIAGTGRFLEFGSDIAEVFVGDPELASVTPLSSRLLYVFGYDVGSTEMQLIDGKGRLIGAITLDLVIDEAALAKELQQIAPLANLDVRDKEVEVTGDVADIDQALKVDRLLLDQRESGQDTQNDTRLTGSDQINLRVRIGEIDRAEVTRLGIDWGGIVNTSSFQFGFGTGQSLAGGIESNNAFLGLDFKNFSLDAVVDLLKQENAIKILAEPNLTVLNGKRAKFLAGGEIPVPIQSSQDAGGTVLVFKPFGVSLEFQPTLLPGNRIQLEVRPEVSSLAQSSFDFTVDGLNLPTFRIRRADTTVELASGQTLALAGLFEQEEVDVIRKMPVLGDLPVLGPLFRSSEYQQNETELIILITPYIVDPSGDPLTSAGPMGKLGR